MSLGPNPKLDSGVPGRPKLKSTASNNGLRAGPGELDSVPGGATSAPAPFTRGVDGTAIPADPG